MLCPSFSLASGRLEVHKFKHQGRTFTVRKIRAPIWFHSKSHPAESHIYTAMSTATNGPPRVLKVRKWSETSPQAMFHKQMIHHDVCPTPMLDVGTPWNAHASIASMFDVHEKFTAITFPICCFFT